MSVLKLNLFIWFQEKIREFEDRLDSGEILTEVPCFESIVTSNSKVSKLVNKKVNL